jgi:hypothetical protein
MTVATQKKLGLDPVTVRTARSLARKVGRPIVKLATQHTTVARMNNAIIATAQASRAKVEITKPVAAPNPARSASCPLRFAMSFSAATAPKIVPRINAGKEKNMPTNAPPLAPVIPHFVPPNRRVPRRTPPMSAMMENTQNTKIQPTAAHEISAGSISL